MKSFFQSGRYRMTLEEKGTPFAEEIDIDEDQDAEVFRVPAHNDIDGADFYHDFKMVSLFWVHDTSGKFRKKRSQQGISVFCTCQMLSSSHAHPLPSTSHPRYPSLSHINSS